MGAYSMKKAGRAYEELTAEVAKALNPNAKVKQGVWVEGPDGRRELDVEIRGTINNKDIFIFIECKDYNLSTTGLDAWCHGASSLS